MIKDINEFRAEKNGTVTPKALLDDLYKNLHRIDRIVVSVKCNDEEIMTAFSSGSALENIGLLEVSKVDLMQTIYSEE